MKIKKASVKKSGTVKSAKVIKHSLQRLHYKRQKRQVWENDDFGTASKISCDSTTNELFSEYDCDNDCN